MTPKESTMAIQASTERIRAVREEIADMPELNTECEYCGESEGHEPDCRFDLAECESCNNLEAFRGDAVNAIETIVKEINSTQKAMKKADQ